LLHAIEGRGERQQAGQGPLQRRVQALHLALHVGRRAIAHLGEQREQRRRLLVATRAVEDVAVSGDDDLQQRLQTGAEVADVVRRAAALGQRGGVGRFIDLGVAATRALPRRHARGLPGHHRRAPVQRGHAPVQPPLDLAALVEHMPHIPLGPSVRVLVMSPDCGS